MRRLDKDERGQKKKCVLGFVQQLSFPSRPYILVDYVRRLNPCSARQSNVFSTRSTDVKEIRSRYVSKVDIRGTIFWLWLPNSLKKREVNIFIEQRQETSCLYALRAWSRQCLRVGSHDITCNDPGRCLEQAMRTLGIKVLKNSSKAGKREIWFMPIPQKKKTLCWQRRCAFGKRSVS